MDTVTNFLEKSSLKREERHHVSYSDWCWNFCWAWIPQNTLSEADILLMAEILHQLRLVVYPIIYRVSAPSQVVVGDFSHQQYPLKIGLNAPMEVIFQPSNFRRYRDTLGRVYSMQATQLPKTAKWDDCKKQPKKIAKKCSRCSTCSVFFLWFFIQHSWIFLQFWQLISYHPFFPNQKNPPPDIFPRKAKGPPFDESNCLDLRIFLAHHKAGRKDGRRPTADVSLRVLGRW